ncbi:MAG: HAMP domain-containing protein, partial [Chloroflexi bacterium]|nr:HAMP domain-containing protein [Chloroflexota bacterium]
MRLPRSLRWRIASAYTVLVVVALGLVSVYLIGFVRGTYVSEIEIRIEHEAQLTADTAAGLMRETRYLTTLQALVDRTNEVVDARVTIIDPSGFVLADSHESPSVMGNHADRPEVIKALADGIGRDTRLSAILGERLVYTAVPITLDNKVVGIARIAVSSSDVSHNLNRILWTVVLAGLIVAAGAVVLGIWIARRTLRSLTSVAEGATRLAKGDLDYRVVAEDTDETRLLAEAFNRMADTVQSTIESLSEEHAKLAAVLDTMGDGVTLVDSFGFVELANKTARDLLVVGGAGSANHERLRDPDLLRLARLAISEGERQQRDIDLVPGPRYVSAIATPLEDERALLTIHDLTSVRQLDVTRREFVSNVSHELRNPLASITAMVETLEAGAAADPQTSADFLARIRGDVERMTALVNDLLTLSRVESGRDQAQSTRVDV